VADPSQCRAAPPGIANCAPCIARGDAFDNSQRCKYCPLSEQCMPYYETCGGSLRTLAQCAEAAPLYRDYSSRAASSAVDTSPTFTTDAYSSSAAAILLSMTVVQLVTLFVPLVM
jgi:hypothetical protein